MRNSKEAYLLWKDNEMTRQFFNEMKQGLEELYQLTYFGKTLDEIGLNAVIRKGKIEQLEKVLEWKPEGYENDSDDQADRP